VRVDASELIAKLECNRCHDIPNVAAAPRDKHCVACHRQILDGTFDGEPELVAKWRGRITSLPAVPSLAGADRLRRDWVRDFLLKPHDVRPELAAEMPRLALTSAQAEKLAAHLVPVDRATPVEGDAAAGEQLYRNMGCARCHHFTGATVDDPKMHALGVQQPPPLDRAWRLAPDLRFARDRVQPTQLAAWMVEPRGLMPKLGVDAAQARDLAAFIVQTPLAALPRKPTATRLPRLERTVTWDEVEAKVFRNVCWHCHAVPDFARGDGGPGNSGGFGFAPRGLDVSSYSGISAGSLDDQGEPRSVFAALPDGTPRIVAHLLARHAEASGAVVDGIRGMPLGLPPLPLEEIQLVDSWIAQGRTR
jgi:hypothetical protein